MVETSVDSQIVPGLFGIRLGDQPNYEVIANEGPIEIRYYDPQTLVSISLLENEDDQEAFIALAKYIYGQNSTTQPIAQESFSSKHERMTSYFMTAPLFQSKNNGSLTISFVLPSHYSLSSAPRPLDPRLFLQEKPSHLKAIIKYASKSYHQIEGDKEMTILQEWIDSHSLYKRTGEFQMAQYDSTGPRRNEIHLEISELH